MQILLSGLNGEIVFFHGLHLHSMFTHAGANIFMYSTGI